MNRNVALGAVAALALSTILPAAARADYYDPLDDVPGRSMPRRQSIDDLVASIALYPDPLLAQLLPAATFPDQVREAARLADDGRGSGYGRRDWDESVDALTHYPSVLQMMADRIEWTTDLGDAYLDDHDRVIDAIQHFREEAYRCGTLVSTREQEVVREDGEIRIWPAQADVIYVPRYDPAAVCRPYDRGYDRGYGGRYSNRPSSGQRILENLISFGAGLAIGSWLNNDVDWHRHQVYHHGWQGGGWVGRSRTRIQLDPRFVGSDWRSRPVTINHNRGRRTGEAPSTPRRNDPSPRYDGRRGETADSQPARSRDPRPEPQRPSASDRFPGRRNDRPADAVTPDPGPGRRWNTDRPAESVTPDPRPGRRRNEDDRPAVRPVPTPAPAPEPVVRGDDSGRRREPGRTAAPDSVRTAPRDPFRNRDRQPDRPARVSQPTPPASGSGQDARRAVRDRGGNDRANGRGSNDRGGNNRSDDNRGGNDRGGNDRGGRGRAWGR